jgi:dTDP-4-dehydrorhamnose reductase
MTYYDKYIKYKNKYLSKKYELTGGAPINCTFNDVSTIDGTNSFESIIHLSFDSSKPTVIIFGGTGTVGSAISDQLKKTYNIITTSRTENINDHQLAINFGMLPNVLYTVLYSLIQHIKERYGQNPIKIYLINTIADKDTAVLKNTFIDTLKDNISSDLDDNFEIKKNDYRSVNDFYKYLDTSKPKIFRSQLPDENDKLYETFKEGFACFIFNNFKSNFCKKDIKNKDKDFDFFTEKIDLENFLNNNWSIESIKVLVNIAKNFGLPLIHLSTVYVHSGNPPEEGWDDSIRDDKTKYPEPTNFSTSYLYGYIKHKVELAIQTLYNEKALNIPFFILRLPVILPSIVLKDKDTTKNRSEVITSTSPSNVVVMLIDKMLEKQETPEKDINLELDNLQIRYPITSYDVAMYISKLIEYISGLKSVAKPNIVLQHQSPTLFNPLPQLGGPQLGGPQLDSLQPNSKPNTLIVVNLPGNQGVTKFIWGKYIYEKIKQILGSTTPNINIISVSNPSKLSGLPIKEKMSILSNPITFHPSKRFFKIVASKELTKSEDFDISVITNSYVLDILWVCCFKYIVQKLSIEEDSIEQLSLPLTQKQMLKTMFNDATLQSIINTLNKNYNDDTTTVNTQLIKLFGSSDSSI